MKKITVLLLFATFFAHFLFADSPSKVSEIKLENGLTIFTLEDYDSPLIRIEFISKAGISSQNENNAGFFTLYSRILEKNLQTINASVQCNADSTRFSLTVPPSQLKTVLDFVAQTVFSPNFTDDTIKTELSALKNEVLENENSLPGFINSAIDSRVFSEAPWKHDSGIYPVLFSRIDYNQARTILNEISQKFYTPQNSALFISGNIESEKIKKLSEVTFGIYYSSTGLPSEKPLQNALPQKKYVLHHTEMSDEMTQIVIQYRNLSPNQCDLAAVFLNNDSSTYKRNLLSNQSLKILGSEYINVSSARKKSSSRLIIQTLLQANSKSTPFEQSEMFLASSKKSLESIIPDEFSFAKKTLENDSNFIFEHSASFMEQLASYWTIKDYDSINIDDKKFSDYANSPTTAAMLCRTENIINIEENSLLNAFADEEPFVFVIMNSAVYAKNKKNFMSAGFEEISTKNASWYSQELFNHIKKAAMENFNEQNRNSDFTDYADFSDDSGKSFYTNNTKTVKKQTLSNGIPLFIKNNDNSAFSTILLNIQGGKLKSSDNNGFEELMTNLLAANIQNEITRMMYLGQIVGNPKVFSATNLTSSEITVECNSSDFDGCIKAISNSIFYTEATPAIADRIVSNLKYKKRLENGDATYQLFAQTINALYGKKQLYNIYEAEKDILQKVDFDHIMEEYSSFLNASRYSFILTGDIPQNCRETIDGEFSKLLDGKKIGSKNAKITDKLTFPVKTQIFAKINHTFLTDIPASKAGKMPAKLIPTTEFIDPVIYVFKKPESLKSQKLCEAFIFYMMDNFPDILTKNNLHIPIFAPNKTSGNREFIPKDCQITVHSDSKDFGFNSMIFKNVAKAKEIEALYIQESLMILRKLTTIGNSATMLQDLKDAWLIHSFSDGNSNTAVAMQIKSSLEETDFINPENYIDSFKLINDASAEDFISIIEKYFIKPELIVYSSDAKNKK